MTIFSHFLTPRASHFACCLLFSALLFLFGCAKIVLPSGGTKDTTPPKVMSEKPENGTINFTGKTIKITFDEYVTLSNPIENVIFSPPMNERVEYSTLGKSVMVKMQDTLRPNTTYNILFSDCIQDFHEGNKLNSYSYAFSTGDSIDKHKLFGKVENAETYKPEAYCFVMLYDSDTDSLPLTVRPNYITKTNANGRFAFNHLKPTSYNVFALKDINSNLIFDLPNELFAFSDQMFDAKYYEKDSLQKADTAAFITLRIFQEEDTVQLLSPYINNQPGVYRFPYKIPVKYFDIRMESNTLIDFFSKINPTNDTISLYLKTFFQESANVYIQTDSQIDTLELYPFKTRMQAGKPPKETLRKLNVNLINKDDLYAPTMLHFSYPIKPVDSIELLITATTMQGKDTTAVQLSIPDTFALQVPLPYTFEPKINYTVWFKDSLFFGYDGSTNDTTQFTLSKKTEKDYGNLFINYIVHEDAEADFIVELLSNQKTVCKEIISSSKTVQYLHLLPGSYRIKVIEDKNRNGKWDTGNYRKKIQPEKIFFFEKEIVIRGFWDVVEDVELLAP